MVMHSKVKVADNIVRKCISPASSYQSMVHCQRPSSLFAYPY